MNDIVFYNLDFEKVYILPASSRETGYVSMTYRIDFADSGTFQLSFWDAELEALIRQSTEGLLLEYGAFQGFLTDYQFKDTEKKAFGMHLNGLLYKEVLPAVAQTTGTLEELAYALIENNYTWLLTAAEVGGFPQATLETDTYKNGNDVINELVQRYNCGYTISFDSAAKTLTFKLLKSEMNPLMLSENNLNAYGFQEDYDIKDAAFGGWYEEEQEDADPIWKYITTAEKTGIRRQNIVLSAKQADEALEELSCSPACAVSSVILPDIPGNISRIFPKGPIFLTCLICSSRSLISKEFSLSFWATSIAFFSSTSSCAFSIRVSTSPMPRIRDAIRSGWKTSRSSSFSPIPANLIGFPVTARTDSAAPPRVSPSSLVRIMPSIPSVSLKLCATLTAS